MLTLTKYSFAIMLYLTVLCIPLFGTQIPFPQKLVSSAHRQIGRTIYYDPAYRSINYPGGDVPLERGVCSDVIIRAMRDQGIDLQQKIHHHMLANWKDYPKNWGLSKPDRNIDHRRVPNIATYFKMKGCLLVPGKSYQPGDVVVWDLGKGILHIGLISDSKVLNENRHKIIHNIGCGVKEEDVLTAFKVIHHFRINKELLS